MMTELWWRIIIFPKPAKSLCEMTRLEPGPRSKSLYLRQIVYAIRLTHNNRASGWPPSHHINEWIYRAGTSRIRNLLWTCWRLGIWFSETIVEKRIIEKRFWRYELFICRDDYSTSEREILLWKISGSNIASGFIIVHVFASVYSRRFEWMREIATKVTFFLLDSHLSSVEYPVGFLDRCSYSIW